MTFRSLVSIVVFLLLSSSLEAQNWHGWESLGSQLQGQPSAVSWGPNRFDICGALNPDLSVWHQWFDGSWGSGESLLTPPNAARWPQMTPPVAVSWGRGRLDIFTLKSPSFDLWHQWFDGSWGSWESLGTPGFGVGMPGLGGMPSVVSWGPNRLDIFAVGLPKGGSYNQLWHGWFDGRAWGPGEWFDPKAALDQQGLSAVSWGPGRLDIFTMKRDKTNLFHQWFDGRAWGSEWFEKPPFGLKGGFSSVSWGPGRLDLFAIGQDGVLWHFWFDGQKWAPNWESLGSPPLGLVGTPSSVSRGPNRIDVFAIKTDGGVWHQWWDGSGWGSGESLPSPPGGLTESKPFTLPGGISAVSWAPNRLDVFAIGGYNGNLWHIWSDAPNVLTQHNDNFRTGAQLQETMLTPAAVRSHGMRIKYRPLEVDDNVDAQPLYARSVAFPDGSANALFTVTAHNSVYAFDADTGKTKWSHWLLDGSPTLRPLAWDAPPTPVIDLGRQVIYVLFGTIDQRPSTTKPPEYKFYWDYEKDFLSNSKVAYWLVALDLRTGAELRRTQLQANATRSDGSTLSFDPRFQLSHPALLLDHGSIYLAFGANPGIEWLAEYHGWVMSYEAATFLPRGVFCTTINSRGAKAEGGGIWQGGGGLAADADGNIYFLTANGPADPASHLYGDSFVKLRPTGNELSFAGSFAPPEAKIMDERDLDLGSGGPIVIPGTRLVAGGGKTGMIYFVDGNTMTMLDSLQAFTNTYHANGVWDYGCPPPPQLPVDGCTPNDSWQMGPHLHGSPTYWRGHLFDWSEKDYLKQLTFNFSANKLNKTTLSGVVQATRTQMPGGLNSLSANGTDTATGIIWAVLPSDYPTPSRVFAFDAESLELLWHDSFPATMPAMSHRAAPTIVDGKLIVASSSKGLVVYELSPSLQPSPRIEALQPLPSIERPGPPIETHRYDESLHRSDRIAPPSDQLVLFRVRAQFDGKIERFDGGQRTGETWEAADGSSVTAVEVKSAPGPDMHSPPWQLFKVTIHKGKGRLDAVDWIQRIDTAGQDATYIFFGAKP